MTHEFVGDRIVVRTTVATETLRFRSHRIATKDIEGTNYVGGSYGSYYIVELTAKGEFPIARFDRKEDRDNIFNAMRLGGYCYHTKASWIRSIPPIEKGTGITEWKWL